MYRNILATINTVVLLMVAYLLCDYLDSAKELNLAAEKRLSYLDEAIVAPLSEKLLPAFVSTIESLRNASPFATDSLNIVEARHDKNKVFTLKVLDVLNSAKGVIYSKKDERNKEPIHRWVQRAKYESSIVSLLSWNERDVLYRLSKKDMGIAFEFLKLKQPDWYIDIEGKKKPITLYEWFYKNEIISTYLGDLENLEGSVK